MIDEGKLSALVSLLDDSDREVFDHVADELISYGAEIIPTLEKFWESTPDLILQERIEQVIHVIHFEKNLGDLRLWAAKEESDLLKGLLILARYQYPELDNEAILEGVYKLRRDIWIEMNDFLSPIEQINILNQLFFKHYKIVDDEKYIEPTSYFLNILLETKKGNPTIVTAFYTALAQIMNIPLMGFPFPFHFCTALVKDDIAWEPDLEIQESDVILYVNVMNQGQIMTRSELQDFIEKLNDEMKRAFFVPTRNRQYLQNIVNQLKEAYSRNNVAEKIKDMDAFLELLEE